VGAHTVRRAGRSGRSPPDSKLSNLAAADAALAVTTEAIQIPGAHGLDRDQPYEANFRDVKTLEVAGGSLEIVRNVTADSVIPEL
jgi:alkylation response protein AidB-like acyl-CoA dehydrogenase